MTVFCSFWHARIFVWLCCDGSCTGTAALALFSWTKWQHHANFFGFQVLVDQKFDNVIYIFCNHDFTVGQCSRISLEKQSTNGFQSVSDGIFVARVGDDVVNSVDQNLAGRARQVVSGWLKRWMHGINNRHYSIRKSKKKQQKLWFTFNIRYWSNNAEG